MKMFPKGRAPSRAAGFSLIEILIATTILLVIVVLASLVFQQTTGAYQTGERKVAAQVALRNILGAITRDLALAVDSADYPGLDVNSIASGKSITFLALTGKPGVDDNGSTVRTAQVITYSFAGGVVTREEQATTCENGRWRRTGSKTTAPLNNADNALSDFEFNVVGDGSLPERVCILAELETKDKISAVGVGSGGRHGWGSSDEIWVGLKP